MSWTWIIPTGEMLNPEGVLVGTGYAGGECGAHPEAVNNPDFCYVKDVGPLPPGKYRMVGLLAESRLGPNAIQLEPVPDENGSIAWMRGRGDFYIHPDLWNAAQKPRSASDGCICGLSAPVRLAMWASPDHDLNVLLTNQPALAVGPAGVLSDSIGK
jgi:hypothetical protein